MELRHLRSFVTLAEELHFGRAAARLHIAQPPLSQQIRRLETELGMDLFRRDRRGVSLTATGQQLLGYARRVLSTAERFTDVAAGLRDGTAGTVRAATVGSALYGPVPTLLARVRDAHPATRITVLEKETAEQVPALLDGEVDIGFLRPPVPTPLHHRIVFREPLVLALPQEHQLASRPRIRVTELADEDFVIFPRPSGPGFYDLIHRVCTDAGFSPRVATHAEHMLSIIGLVGIGTGVAMVPASATNLTLPHVAYRPLQDAPQVALALAWNPTDLTALVEAVVARLIAVADLPR